MSGSDWRRRRKKLSFFHCFVCILNWVSIDTTNIKYTIQVCEASCHHICHFIMSSCHHVIILSCHCVITAGLNKGKPPPTKKDDSLQILRKFHQISVTRAPGLFPHITAKSKDRSIIQLHHHKLFKPFVRLFPLFF